MIIISDTTATSTLLQLGELRILSDQFPEVIIPDKVLDELQALSAFNINVEVLNNAPWLSVRPPSPLPLLSLLENMLDAGEAQAIALAVELNADLLIIDEKNGRAVAQSLKLPYTGLGGVLIRAKQAGLIKEVKPFLERMQQETTFYLSKAASAIILKAAGEL